ncbi:hypothetical protein WR164_03750 [Philodulcilactobacillus myokoensis]|uniref:HTH cro/C1-type domain-containing protein n=1 Tax=Philodulcilactobacillus myokoensis TaxID=2929573 RepID=A0A9W6B0Q1_9LACO|nr:helix-turn-helix transcriptional regulator [Philodulcilactobacillus myokoensis]GLB46396.1 hypothetical protein WR164_03750 [Philodulcilactobacillus myokoensis]
MISNRLRDLIDERHISISNLSRQVHLSRNTIYNLINNQNLHGYQIQTLNKICSFFHVNIGDVLNFVEDKLTVKFDPKQVRMTQSVNHKAFYVSVDCSIIHHKKEIGTVKLMTKIDITYHHVIRLIYQIDSEGGLNKDYVKAVFNNPENLAQPVVQILSLPHIHNLIDDNYDGEILPVTGAGDNDQQSFDFDWNNQKKTIANFKKTNLKSGYLNPHDRFIFQ